MIKEELKKEIEEALSTNKPKNWRKGQFVFNYIDIVYGVAREVQYLDGVDCFYRDELIDQFIEKAAIRIERGREGQNDKIPIENLIKDHLGEN